jgi:peptidyl-prolyl cis-trans isomerase B (cyclophilin B)
VAQSAKRERQLAREHYERQQERRAARAAKRRQTQQIAAVVVAVAVIVGGIAVLTQTLGGNPKNAAAGSKSSASAKASTAVSPTPTPSATASTPGAGCTYTKAGAAAKNVGLPAYDPKKAASYKSPFSATLATDQGDIVIRMAADKAPCTTNSFRHLAQAKYFNGTSCHRLTTANIFVLQCGDPTATGNGGPGYQFGVENAPSDGVYPAGTVAMARTSDPGTNGSQFFVVYKDTTLPDAAGYTIFGTVTKGLDVVTKLAAKGVEGGGSDGKPAQPIKIKTVTLGKA